MVDSRLVAHEGHAARAHAFRFQCTADAAGDGRACLEFPPTAEPILQVGFNLLTAKRERAPLFFFRLFLLSFLELQLFFFFSSAAPNSLASSEENCCAFLFLPWPFALIISLRFILFSYYFLNFC